MARIGVTYPTDCQQNVPWGTSANADEQRYQAYGELHFAFSDAVNLFGEFSYLRTRTALADTPGAAVRPATGTPSVTIPGYAPSNAFRAMDASGVPLYAQNSNIRLGFDKDGIGGNYVASG